METDSDEEDDESQQQPMEVATDGRTAAASALQKGSSEGIKGGDCETAGVVDPSGGGVDATQVDPPSRGHDDPGPAVNESTPDWRRLNVRVLATRSGGDQMDESAVIEALLADGGVTVSWDDGSGRADLPAGWFTLAPCAAWAEEDVDAYPTGPAPVPTAEQLFEGKQCCEAPHPRWARAGGCCDSCRAAAPRPPRKKVTTRPIRIGDVWTRLAERGEAFASKARMRKALMPVQTGVGVPGGLSMMTAFVEAMMRLDRGKRKLDVDIANMFNELCRVTLMEELLGSEELLGVDFSDLAPYFESAFMQEYGNWFWVEGEAEAVGQGVAKADRGGGQGRWEWIESAEGLPQGSPLSCFGAALGGVRCVLAAQEAMDGVYGLDRAGLDTASDVEKEACHRLASAASAAVAMLDDASFVARMRALCAAYTAYTAVCRGRGWSCKPEKTVLSGDYYTGERPVTDGFAPVEPPLMARGSMEELEEEAELRRPLEGTPDRGGDDDGREPVRGGPP